MRKPSQYECNVSGIASSKAIQGDAYKGVDFSELSEEIMTKKELHKHRWILETMMFQRIAETGKDSYMDLYRYYDECFGKKTAKQREVIAENAKINMAILKNARK